MSVFRPLARALVVSVLFVFAGAAAAQALQPPEVAAKSYLVLDLTTKQTLAEVRIEDQEFYRPLAAIHKKNKVLSPAMKQFLNVLKGSS